MYIRQKFRLTVYGADNEILIVREFCTTDYCRTSFVNRTLAMFDGEWVSYIVSMVG